MGAAGRTLLRVVHRSIHADFFQSFRCGCRNRVADCEVDRRRALLHATAARVADASVIHHASRTHLARRLAVEQVAAVDAVELEGVRCIALAIGPDRRIAEPGVNTRTAGQFSIHAGRHDRNARKAAGWQRNRLKLGLVQNVAVGRIDGVHQWARIDRHGIGHCARLQVRGQRDGAVGLYLDRRKFFDREAIMLERDRIGPDRQIWEGIQPGGAGVSCAGEMRALVDHLYFRARQCGTLGVSHSPNDSAQRLLRCCGAGCERGEHHKDRDKRGDTQIRPQLWIEQGIPPEVVQGED